MNIQEIQQWDKVIITGIASCPHGYKAENLLGTVDTLDKTHFKFLPDKDIGRINGINCEKMWFAVEQIEKCELVDRYNN